MATALDRNVTDLVADLFEPLVLSARERFSNSEVIQLITSPECDPVLLDRFLIQYCSQGVNMTEPVEGWIRRAGERTEAMGLTELGQALQRHASHESNHHLLMIDDTRRLVELWNEAGREPLDADELLNAPASRGTVEYVELHESVIAGDTPYAQIGIEYEIEMLSITAGVKLLTNVATICGENRIEALTFLKDHVELDVGHTEFNRRQLEAILTDHPECVGPIGEAGAAALHAYRQFLTDCLMAIR